MSVVRLSYVICDVCGVPATQPVMGGAARTARQAAPLSWKAGRDGDRCPAHKPADPVPSEGQDGYQVHRQGGGYFAALDPRIERPTQRSADL